MLCRPAAATEEVWQDGAHGGCGALPAAQPCLRPFPQGMCYTHAQACGGGTCAYLLAKMTRLLVLRKNR